MRSSTSVQRRPGLAPRILYFATAGLAGGAVATITKLLDVTDSGAMLSAIVVVIAFVAVATPFLLGKRG
jgi:hypothetical protein